MRIAQREGRVAIEPPATATHRNPYREWIGAQILADLGIRKMRVMSAPKHLHALAGFDLEVVEFVNTE